MPARFNVFSLSPGSFLVFFSFAFLLTLIPVLSHHYLSINDLLNHISRVWVLLHLDTLPSLREYYRIEWFAIPDVGIDLFGFIVGKVLGPELTAKSFVAAIIFLNLSGVAHLHRAIHGKWSLWPLCAAPLMFNRNLLAGLVNYLFGLGLCLHAVAFWISFRDRPVLRSCVTSACALGVFFSHLLAFGLLGVMLGAIELWWLITHRSRHTDWLRKFLELSVVFLPSLLIFLFLSPHDGLGASIRFHSILGRLTAFGTPILYNTLADLALFGAFASVALSVLTAKGTFRVDKSMTLVALCLIIGQLVAPFSIMTSTNVDQRIPILIYMVIVAATDISCADRRFQFLFAAALFTFIGARAWMINERWKTFDAVYTDVDRTLASIAPGAKVVTAFSIDNISYASAPAMAMFYLPVRSVVMNGGFVQTLFARLPQNMVTLKPQYEQLSRDTDPNTVWNEFSVTQNAARGALQKTYGAVQRYDYIVFLSNRETLKVHREPWMIPEAEGRWSLVFKVKHPSGNVGRN